MKTYLKSLGSPVARRAYAKRAGTSIGYLNNIAGGAKEPKTLKTIANLIDASGGHITIDELCPSLMSGSQGRKYRRILTKALADTPAKPKRRAAA